MSATAEKLMIHPLAELIPAMAADEFRELCEDIAENGLREPIVLYQQKVLDGRHRYRACLEVGVEPTFRDYAGEEPAGLVLSLNIKRRNLTPSQRAAIAVEFLPALERERKDRQRQGLRRGAEPAPLEGSRLDPRIQTGTSSHRTREEAGARVGVSGATVDRARRVKEQAPESFELVKAGAMTVKHADEQLRAAKNPNRSSGPQHVGSRWARTPVQLVENTMKNLAGIPLVVAEIDTAAAVGDPSAPLKEWDRTLTRVIVCLTQIRGTIRKETG
jgi:ParB-like nuclease domain